MLNYSTERKASIAMTIAASIWGLYWVPIHYLEGFGISGISAVALINVIPAIVLLGLTSLQWRDVRGTFGRAALVGFVAGLGFALYSLGIVYGSVVRTTLLFYLTPIWSTIIGILWLSEQTTWRRWLAIATGLLGLSLLVSGGTNTQIGIGDIFAFVSGIVWAVAATLIRANPSLPLPSMAGTQFAATAITTCAVGYILGAQTPTYAAFASALPIATVVTLVFFLPSVIAIFWAQKRLFPGRAGLLMMSEALVAVVSAALWFPEERLQALQWVGAVMIVSTFFIETMGTPQKKVALKQA